jgi:hypothetical protein
MKRIGFIIGLIILTSSAFGQQNSSNQTTSLCGGRWEFFMSEVVAKVTLRIDKHMGDVYVLAQRRDGTITWELIRRENSEFDIRKEDSINYQLFSSGIGIQHTYLINTNSGFTWRLVESRGTMRFEAIKE